MNLNPRNDNYQKNIELLAIFKECHIFTCLIIPIVLIEGLIDSIKYHSEDDLDSHKPPA